MDLYIIEIAILFIFLILSSFFSGSETALFALKKSDLHQFSMSGNKNEKAISYNMRKPQNILITILLGNLFANFVVSNFTARMFLKKWPIWGHWISILIVTPIIIILCEISPKVIAINNFKWFSKKIFPLLKSFHVLFLPLRIVLLFITEGIIKLFGLKLQQRRITEDDLGFAVDIGEEEGVIDKEEGNFLKNVMIFSKKEAANVMFPRNMALFIPYEATIDEAMALFQEAEVIRAPVYKKDLDHVVGIIDSRELLPYFYGFKKGKKINRLIREIKFFPASRELHFLLQDFLNEGIQIAIVVDEYGGTAGVVTLNSILSELMGKNYDKLERDYVPEVAIERISETESIISGDMQIHDFNFHFDDTIESIEADSIAGYIIEAISYLPDENQEIMTDRYILRVKSVAKNKIEFVQVIKREEEE